MAAKLQLQAKALGDPTCHRLFRYVADAQSPVTVAELTAYAGLNHNAVRQHLAVLKEAGLVTEEPERRNRPGRPRLLNRLHPEVAAECGTQAPTPGWPGCSRQRCAAGRTAPGRPTGLAPPRRRHGRPG